MDKKFKELKDQVDKLGWREANWDFDEDDDAERLNIIKRLLDTQKIEYIGGIDQEDENGELIDVDRELDTFFNLKDGCDLYGFTSYKAVRLGGETFVIYNDSFPFSGSVTEIYRIAK